MNGNFIVEKSMSKDEEFLDIAPETQKFIAKKLSKALDKMLVEVVIDGRGVKKIEDEVEGIYLFSSSGDRISSCDIQKMEGPQKKQKKPKLKRKRHVDGSDSEDEDAKLRAVAVSADWVKSSVY